MEDIFNVRTIGGGFIYKGTIFKGKGKIQRVDRAGTWSWGQLSCYTSGATGEGRTPRSSFSLPDPARPPWKPEGKGPIGVVHTDQPPGHRAQWKGEEEIRSSKGNSFPELVAWTHDVFLILL